MPRGKNQRGTSTPRGTGRGNKQHVADEDLRRSSRNGNSISDQDAAQTQLNPQQSYQQLPPSNSNDGEFSQLDVSCLLARVNRLSKDLKFLCDENTQLKGEIILIKSALNSQTKKISELEIELDDLQQYGRRENVCFSNLKIDDKPVIDQVISLCEEINVTVTKNDLVDVHPLPSTRGHAKRIIARFKDRKLGQQVMGARKSAKNIGANKKKQLAADPSRGFGIQPNITSKRAMLLKQAKAAVEKGHKLVDGQRGTKRLLDTDGHLYSRRADRETLVTSYWRCQKYRSQKCSAAVTLLKEDLTLITNQKPHSHLPGTQVTEKLEFRQSLKRKAFDQHLSATQNILTEALSGCSSDLNVELPKLESLARVVQRC
ncbi:hypothetical protein ACHWQZ_G003877 [Mnemiopsis leidyi]